MTFFSRSIAKPQSAQAQRRLADKELLQKGLLIAIIGAAVLLAPGFMAATPMREMVAASSLVGWFALVLGCAFIGRYVWRRFKPGQ
jgi:uncharacterized membrane protein HdeD (DUF308 family)